MLPLTLPLLLTLLSPDARAVDQTSSQELVYDLRLGNRVVGSREVTLRYLDTGNGVVRVIESYTALETNVAGAAVSYANRASARVETRGASFTSSVSENGRIREVQARQRRDGSWKVTIIEDGQLATTTLRADQVDLSSLELLDPVRHRELTERPRAEVLAAETGTLLAGTVEDLGEGTLTVGGQDIAVHRWAWSPAAGRHQLAWSLDGLLVAYDATWMGSTLSAVLREPPPARSYGEIGPVPDVVEDVSELEL